MDARVAGQIEAPASWPHPAVRLVVPVLDEAAALPGLLAELDGLGLLGLTLFVDNGSRDGGQRLVREAGAALLHEPRRGYGYPCLTGARAAMRHGARVVVFMEADGTDDPAEAHDLARPILEGVADLVIGSRHDAVRRVESDMPLHQRLGNDWLSLSLALLFGLQLSDDGPFRAVRADLLARLRLEERGYAFPTEMAVKAHLVGARIMTRETSYRQRAGRSKIGGTWRGSALAVRDITWSLVRLRLAGFELEPATPARRQ
jgi:glycosyltransferase involved in cell wall biosynthesis